MLLDEELTESMRQHTTSFRAGVGYGGARIGDSIVDFENQGMDEACTDLPPSPMLVEGQRNNNNNNNNNGSPIPDFRDFDAQPSLGVSTDNIGLLIFSGLQQQMGMGAAPGFDNAAGLTAARQFDSNNSDDGGQGPSTMTVMPLQQQSQSRFNVRVNPSMQMVSSGGMKRSASREALFQRTDLSVSKFSRGCPLESCSFLERGVSFGGTQDVSPSVSGVKESWDLKITVEERDFSKGYVCGTMYANGFNCSENSGAGGGEKNPVVTFWEGALIDSYNHFFYTQKWGASKTTDRSHWLKLAPFCKAFNNKTNTTNQQNQSQNQDPIDLTGQPFIYMRLKEKYFLNEEPGGNLTIAGFYYLCISRATGEVTGYYFDPNSTPYQEVKLQVIYEGESGFISAGGDLI
jgi:hypothetical protein